MVTLVGAKVTTMPALMTPLRRVSGGGRAADARLDTADRDRANAADLVHVLERQAERLVGRAGRGLDSVDGLEEGLALLDTGLGLRHQPGRGRARRTSLVQPLNQPMFVDSSIMLSPCQPEIGTKATDLGL